LSYQHKEAGLCQRRLKTGLQIKAVSGARQISYFGVRVAVMLQSVVGMSQLRFAISSNRRCTFFVTTALISFLNDAPLLRLSIQ